jgi:polysaccharide pyruvyl transferase WcaK-like protein
MTDAKRLPELNIGLLWHSPNSGNLGVGALTVANISLAARAADKAGVRPKFSTIGFRDEGTQYIHADRRVHLNGKSLLSPLGYVAQLDDFDCLLDIGGGDSFTDIYGPKRFAYLWLTKVLALAKRKPLLLSPQTIGPFSSRISRRMAGYVLRRADAVFARDSMSMAAIREIAPCAHAHQSVDVAFALPYLPAERSCGRTRIGLNISGLLFNKTLDRHRQARLSYDYAEFARRILSKLSADPQNQIELICHVSAPEQRNDDDGIVADQLSAEFPNIVRVPSFESPSEAKGYISGLDFLIAGRMHACIAAYSAGVPFVATAYSRKFSGLFGMLDYPGVLPSEHIAISDATDFVFKALSQPQLLKAAIDAGRHKIDDLLSCYERELSVFFKEAARGASRSE